MEVFFPGSSKVDRRFAVEFVELPADTPTPVGPASVTAFVVKHASGAAAYALRVEYGGKVITYSGDTEWTESLVDAARGADVFVCEAYFFESPKGWPKQGRGCLRVFARIVQPAGLPSRSPAARLDRAASG